VLLRRNERQQRVEGGEVEEMKEGETEGGEFKGEKGKVRRKGRMRMRKGTNRFARSRSTKSGREATIGQLRFTIAARQHERRTV